MKLSHYLLLGLALTSSITYPVTAKLSGAAAGVGAAYAAHILYNELDRLEKQLIAVEMLFKNPDELKKFAKHPVKTFNTYQLPMKKLYRTLNTFNTALDYARPVSAASTIGLLVAGGYSLSKNYTNVGTLFGVGAACSGAVYYGSKKIRAQQAETRKEIIWMTVATIYTYTSGAIRRAMMTAMKNLCPSLKESIEDVEQHVEQDLEAIDIDFSRFIQDKYYNVRKTITSLKSASKGTMYAGVIGACGCLGSLLYSFR